MARKHPCMTKWDIVIVLHNPHQSEDTDVNLIKEILKTAGSHVMGGSQQSKNHYFHKLIEINF